MPSSSPFLGWNLDESLKYTIAKVNLIEVWFKIEISNREAIPCNMEVESHMGISIINISLFSSFDGDSRTSPENGFRAYGGHMRSMQ